METKHKWYSVTNIINTGILSVLIYRDVNFLIYFSIKIKNVCD